MKRENFLVGLYIIYVFSCTLWAYVSAKTCVKTGACQCYFAEDDTHIDLSPLAGNPPPKWKDEWDESRSNQYSYNPCHGFNEGTCSDVAVCQLTGKGKTFPAGSQATAEMTTDSGTGEVTISYSSTDAIEFTRTSKVTLRCTQDGIADSLYVKGEDLNQQGLYIFTLSSYHSCPKPGKGAVTVIVEISVGTVLVIVFISVVAVYCTGGMMFQKFGRKAQGRQIVPNYTFWTGLPGLVKDGTLFVARGCKGRAGYTKH